MSTDNELPYTRTDLEHNPPLHYEVHGCDPKEAEMIIIGNHGGPGGRLASSWKDTIPDDIKDKVTFIAVQQQGSGELSHFPTEEVNMDVFTKGLLAIKEREFPNSKAKVVGLGHSFGTTVTMAQAAKHPEFFDELILVGTFEGDRTSRNELYHDPLQPGHPRAEELSEIVGKERYEKYRKAVIDLIPEGRRGENVLDVYLDMIKGDLEPGVEREEAALRLRSWERLCKGSIAFSQIQAWGEGRIKTATTRKEYMLKLLVEREREFDVDFGIADNLTEKEQSKRAEKMNSAAAQMPIQVHFYENDCFTNFEEAAKSIAAGNSDMHVVSVNGEDDFVCPVDEGKPDRVAQALKDNGLKVEDIVVEGAGHNPDQMALIGYNAEDNTYETIVRDALKSSVEKAIGQAFERGKEQQKTGFSNRLDEERNYDHGFAAVYR